ncbi:hypothetical protein LOK49_LG03G02522 [Camellia lanceoleosa]|uniref:Uncharacterized protein n=1 Tax=Camellia lanceoleosa TaxID=1840588 RepID=A0ACC0IAB9_9ERIC|nr:hypothetical protein LOK49_LG03G02522 [Camellia lanceoleosa]
MDQDLERGNENREEAAIALARERAFISSTAVVYFALLGLLAAIIQTTADPFRTHRKTMQVFLMSVCIYSLVLLLKELFELQGQRIIGDNYARIICHVILIVGALSPVSLVSVLVSERIIWLPYVIWFICSVIVLHLEAWDFFTGFLAPWIAGPGNGN